MSLPRRSELLQKYRHAGGHLRDPLLEALEFQDDWWKHIDIDFNLERHQRS